MKKKRFSGEGGGMSSKLNIHPWIISPIYKLQIFL